MNTMLSYVLWKYVLYLQIVIFAADSAKRKEKTYHQIQNRYRFLCGLQIRNPKVEHVDLKKESPTMLMQMIVK